MKGIAMADRMRWCYGDIKPIEVKVLPDTLIEAGDMLWMDKDNAKPACLFPTGVFVNPENAIMSFVCNFLGIAMEASRKGEIKPVNIATSGTFEMDCINETFREGDLVGPGIKAIRKVLEAHQPVRIPNQQIAKTYHRELSIGKIARSVPVPYNSVLVTIDTSHRAHKPKHVD